MAGLNAVIDISHHNGTALDFAKAKADGIAGVIHKASQGLTLGDARYAANRKAAVKAGLFWGAYHFGENGDGVKQADHFLAQLGDPKHVLMALDFVTRIHKVTGRWPGFYSASLIKQVLGSKTDAVLANCWFCLAQYGPAAVVPANWSTWTLWQYTDGVKGSPPFEVDGIGKCDRDRFNGSLARLKALWGV